MKNWKHRLFLWMICISCIGVVYIIWATMIDGIYVRQPLLIYEHQNGEQIQTDKQEYRRGEIVKGLIKFCKNRDIDAEFQWNLIDSYLKLYPKRKGSVVPGCHEVLIEIEAIPADQIIGDAYFETTVTYKINAFNIIKVPIRTNVFYVTQ